MKKENSNLLAYVISFVFLIMYVLLFYLNLDEEKLSSFFNSDFLYLPALYKDVLVNGNSFYDWKLTPAPYFFYDMPLYFLLMFITRSFLFSTYAYGIIQFFLFVAIFKYLIKKITHKRDLQVFSMVNLIACIFILTMLLSEKCFMVFHFIFLPSVHGSALILSLLSLLITAEYFEKNDKKLLFLLFIIVFLGIISDKIFVVMFCLPFLSASLLLISRKIINASVVLPMAAATIIPSILGFLFYKSHFWVSKQIPDPPFRPFIPSLKAITNDILNYYFKGTSSIIIIAFLIVISYVLFLVLHKKILNTKDPIFNYYLTFSFFFMALVISAPIIKGVYAEPCHVRYLVGALIFAFFNIILLISYNRIVLSSKIICVLLLISCIFFIKITYKEKCKMLFSYYPKKTQELDEICSQYGINKGFADYWYAKYNSMFSKKGVSIVQVTKDITQFHWSNNVKWYKNADLGNLILITKDLNKNAIIRTYGIPDKIINDDEYFIYLRSAEKHH